MMYCTSYAHLRSKKSQCIYVTESVKTGLITHDRKFDFITQIQSLINALSNIMATDSQSKGICFL